MIGIYSHNDKIFKYLKYAGLGTHNVVYNPRYTNTLSCVLRVGGSDVFSTHCYITGEKPLTIPVLDPLSVIHTPINDFYIKTAIAKAAKLDKTTNIPKLLAAYRVDVEIIETRLQFDAFITLVNSHTDLVSIDIECEPTTTAITCIGFSIRQNDKVKAFVVPLCVEFESFWSEADETYILLNIAKFLKNENVKKLFQNFIFDCMVLARHGLFVRGPIYDTMTLQHLISPELKRSLADLARIHLIIEPWKQQKSWLSNKDLWLYNGRDAGYTLLIHEQQMLTKELQDADLNYLYTNHLVSLSGEVLRMCERGWDVDLEYINKAKDTFEAKAADLLSILRSRASDFIRPKRTYLLRKGKIKTGAVYCRGVGEPVKKIIRKNKKGEEVIQSIAYDSYKLIELPPETKKLSDVPFPVFEVLETHREFNPKSPDQVKELVLALIGKIPTRRGKETTDDLALKTLSDKYPHIALFDQILDYRKTTKIIDTYCNVKLDPDSKLRFNIVIPGTVGSRFSAKKTFWDTGFNAQNLPNEFRRAVVAPEGFQIVGVDFKQADPHMVAWLSGCEKMINVLQTGDLHCYTASILYDRTITKKDEKERQDGKMCNNAFNYGMQPFTYMSNARKKGRILSEAEAQRHYEAFHAAWPEISGIWYPEVEMQLRRSKKLVTPFGRHRYFYGHMHDDYAFKKIFNEALSYVPQTHVSDALNRGNILFMQKVRESSELRDCVFWIQQGHDGNLWLVRNDLIKSVIELLQVVYSSVKFDIKGRECVFPIELKVGPNWKEMKEWKHS